MARGAAASGLFAHVYELAGPIRRGEADGCHRHQGFQFCFFFPPKILIPRSAWVIASPIKYVVYIIKENRNLRPGFR